MSEFLKSVRAYVRGKGICKADILIENGRFSLVNPVQGEESTFSENVLMVPGFIDQHIHGAAGADAMDGTNEALRSISLALAEEGTTSFLATTMTQSEENICNALKNIKEYMASQGDEGAKVLGVHLEGPYVSCEFCGAQPKEYIRKLSVEDFKIFEKASGNNIRLVTLAPEGEGSEELIPYLKRRKIVCSLGHTAAGYAAMEHAVELGARNVTHTYNALKPLHHREIGGVGAALLSDKLNCEIICDTIHVSVPAIRLLVKTKPRGKVTMITDAMRAKGLPDGVSELGGQQVFVKDGQARLSDGTLAGSVLRMNVALANMVEKVGVPLEKAIDFATFNPAKNLHMEKEIGSIGEGKRADYTLLDEKFNVLMTVRGGKIIYKRR